MIVIVTGSWTRSGSVISSNPSSGYISRASSDSLVPEYGVDINGGRVVKGTYPPNGKTYINHSFTGTKGVTYSIRNYYRLGTSYYYGSTVSITIPSEPTVTTAAATLITMTGATGGGNVTNGGTAAVTARGFHYGTTNPPATQKACGSGTGAFTGTMTGLVEGQLYYLRAYATNSVGTGYGSVLSFTTLSRPTVTTQAVTSIGTSTATGNGNVTVQGSTAVTSRGICWNTSTNPTIANSKTISGSGLGAFTSPITGLTQGTLYYVRAFATNSVGTNYGSVVTFTSGIIPPVLTGGTDTSSFPNIGWSGKTSTPTWTAATHIRWYHKVSTAPSYTLIDTVLKATLTKQYLGLIPNTNYSFYCTYYKTGTESGASNVITINNAVANPTATYSSILMI